MHPEHYGPREPFVEQDEHVHRADGLVHIVYIPAMGGLVWHAWCDENWEGAKRTTTTDKAGDAAATCLKCIIKRDAHRRKYA